MKYVLCIFMHFDLIVILSVSVTNDVQAMTLTLNVQRVLATGSKRMARSLFLVIPRYRACRRGAAPAFTDYVGSLPYLAPEVVRLNCGGSTAPYDEKCGQALVAPPHLRCPRRTRPP